MQGADDFRKNPESRVRVLRGMLDERTTDAESMHAAINRYYNHGHAGNSPGP